MSNGSSWKNTLKRTKDSLERKYRRSKDFISSLRSVGDERQGIHRSGERHIPESDQMSEETPLQGEGQSDVQSEVSSEIEMHDSQNSDKGASGDHHFAREPMTNDSAPNDDFPRSLENRTRTGESRVSAPLFKGKTTTYVNGSSSQETLSEKSHTDEVPGSEQPPDKKFCLNSFLSNDPLERESSTREPHRGRPLTREPEVEDSLPGERSSTARPDMAPSHGENSFMSNTFAPNTFAPNSFDASTSGEPGDVENIEQPEHAEDFEQFEHDEDVEWFEHVEYADQDLYVSLPVDESTATTSNDGNSRTTSTSTSLAPTSRRPLATAENNRLLRLPLEIRLMIYDELLSIPRSTPLLHAYQERQHNHPFHIIRKVDKELFTRRARLRFKHSRPGIGYYDPRTTTFTARFTDDDLCTHRQWGSEHLGAITTFAPRLPRLQQHRPRAGVGAAAGAGPVGAVGAGPTQTPPTTNNNNHGRSRGTALLYGICSPSSKRANFLTWQAIHAHLLQSTSTTPFPSPSPAHSPSPSTAIHILELSFPRICSAINVLKSLVLGRMIGWRELRRLSVLRIRIRAAGGEEEEEEGDAGRDGGGGGGGPLNEVDMVALYSLALTLAEEMERKVLLRRGPWIEIAW